MDEARRLPGFATPPINEVVLGVQSDKLALTTPFLGLYWAEVRAAYPATQVQPALDPVMERFGERPETLGPVPESLRILDKPETPRCWFIDSAGNRLIQLQQDRLIHNWRRIGDTDEYPHYTKVRETFIREYERLQDFVEKEKGRAGELVPDWCEVTYVNHIVQGSGWQHPGDIHRVFTVISERSGARFLPAPEQGAFALSFMMPDDTGQPIGRLHVSSKNAVRRKDGVPLLVFDLTARGRPNGPGVIGVLGFLDKAHEWIVRGFAELTTPAMHALWGRRDV